MVAGDPGELAGQRHGALEGQHRVHAGHGVGAEGGVAEQHHPAAAPGVQPDLPGRGDLHVGAGHLVEDARDLPAVAGEGPGQVLGGLPPGVALAVRPAAEQDGLQGVLPGDVGEHGAAAGLDQDGGQGVLAREVGDGEHRDGDAEVVDVVGGRPLEGEVAHGRVQAVRADDQVEPAGRAVLELHVDAVGRLPQGGDGVPEQELGVGAGQVPQFAQQGVAADHEGVFGRGRGAADGVAVLAEAELDGGRGADLVGAAVEQAHAFEDADAAEADLQAGQPGGEPGFPVHDGGGEAVPGCPVGEGGTGHACADDENGPVPGGHALPPGVVDAGAADGIRARQGDPTRPRAPYLLFGRRPPGGRGLPGPRRGDGRVPGGHGGLLVS